MSAEYGPTTGERETRLWRVAGRVQGVGFRAFVRRRALELGVSGYARNMPDGTVEVLARGDADALAVLQEALRIGPRYARVESVTEWPVPDGAEWDSRGGRGRQDGFVIY